MGFDGQVIRFCATCFEVFEVGVSPDPTGRCERCRDRCAASRRGIVGRLRAYYAAAREFVDTSTFGDPHHAHLEWILGSRRRPDRDDASFAVEVSEVMVLWLEDLASEVESATGAAGRLRVPGRRESAARGLRAATRDFADAFLPERPADGSRP